MSALPDTTTGKDGGRTRPVVLLAAGFCAALLLAAALSVGRRDFAPGEELVAPGVEDVAVSRVATSYPDSDALRFDAGVRVVYVYLRVEDLDAGGDLEARVERSGRTPALAWLSGVGDLRVIDAEEDRLGVSDGGVSGVVRFAVRAGSGEPLPTGDYTVGVYAAEGSSRVVVAKKYFVVGH